MHRSIRLQQAVRVLNTRRMGVSPTLYDGCSVPVYRFVPCTGIATRSYATKHSTCRAQTRPPNSVASAHHHAAETGAMCGQAVVTPPTAKKKRSKRSQRQPASPSADAPYTKLGSPDTRTERPVAVPPPPPRCLFTMNTDKPAPLMRSPPTSRSSNAGSFPRSRPRSTANLHPFASPPHSSVCPPVGNGASRQRARQETWQTKSPASLVAARGGRPALPARSFDASTPIVRRVAWEQSSPQRND